MRWWKGSRGYLFSVNSVILTPKLYILNFVFFLFLHVQNKKNQTNKKQTVFSFFFHVNVKQ